MNTLEFLLWEQTSRDTIDLKKVYVDVAGDLVSGVLLSQIIFWNLPNQEGRTKLRVTFENKLWLAKGREDWWHECRISPKQFDRSIKILEEKKIVETSLKKFNGSPMKHIYLNLEELVKQIGIILNQQSEGELDFNQRVKSNLTKGKNENSLKGKKVIPEREISLTENTTENTPEIITNNSDTKEVFEKFEQCGFGLLSSIMIEKIKSDIERFGKTWVMKAAEIADENGKRSYAYVKAILEKWNTDGGIKLKPDKNTNFNNKKESTFNNFKQRSYDFKDLEKKLLGWE